MAAQTTPLDAIARTTWTARDAIFVSKDALSRAEAAMRNGEISNALAAAEEAATQANALVTSLAAARLLLTTMPNTDAALASRKFALALDS